MPSLSASRVGSFVLSLLIAGGLAGCETPADQSRVAATLRGVSFDPPPEAAEAAEPGGGTAAAPPVRQQAQVYLGREVARPIRIDGPPARRTADGVEVNFDGAEIREVARVILGDVLNLPYNVDPRVQGTVTLSTGGPLPEADLLPLLETVLRNANATLLRSGGIYAIVPAGEHRGPGEVLPLGGDIRVAPGFGLTAVRLRYISAQAAAQLIQPMLDRVDDIRVETSRNLILFTGTSAERQNALDTLADLDVNWLAGKSVGIFPLTYATPEAVIPELEVLFAPGDVGGGPPPQVRFLPIARLNAVLAIAGSAEQIRDIQAWVERLDNGRTVGVQYYVYQLRHAPAEDIARLMNEIFGSGAATAAEPVSPFASALSARPAATADQATGAFAEPSAVASPIPFGEATDHGPLEAGGDGAPGGVRFVANRNNNSLLIRATPQAYESIEATLRRLDTPPLQVLIEATIAEVTLNDALRYGLQYFFQFGDVSFGFNTPRGPGITTGGGRDGFLSNSGFNFLLANGDAVVAIDALSQLTSVKVLSSPSVVVQDNSAAVLTVGEEVPVQTAQQQAVTAQAPIINSIEYRNTGVILEVRPRINTNRTVSLDVSQEVSRVAPSAGTTAGTDVNLTPTFTQRKITSRINITSGQTVVLGGLIQDSEIRTKDKIPVLGDVPVVGELFSSTSNSTTRTELIVFITPRIVRNAEDARDVSEELRARMRSLRPAGALPEAAAPPPEPAPGPMPLAPAAVIAPPTEELAPTAGIAPATEAPPAPERSRFDLARAPLPAARPAPPTPVPLARP